MYQPASQNSDKGPVPLPKYVPVKPSARRKFIYPCAVEGVEPIDSVTPFREDNDPRILELGAADWSQYLETELSLTLEIMEPSLAGQGYKNFLAAVWMPGAGAIQTMNLYLQGRITAIFDAIHRSGERFRVQYKHDTLRDDKFLWCIDNDERTRFAALALFKPGTLRKDEFKRVMAGPDESESDFFAKHRKVTMSVCRQDAVDVITKLRNLYNNYGCCNVAACDFETLFALDLRPRVKPEHPGTFAKASFIHLGGTTSQDWKHFQNVLLGFLERGYQWIEPERSYTGPQIPRPTFGTTWLVWDSPRVNKKGAIAQK